MKYNTMKKYLKTQAFQVLIKNVIIKAIQATQTSVCFVHLFLFTCREILKRSNNN